MQVLVLDSLDLDVNSKPQGVYPRFALFDYDSMKKMVDAISVNMGGGEISYHRSSVSPRITFSIIPNHTIFT